MAADDDLYEDRLQDVKESIRDYSVEELNEIHKQELDQHVVELLSEALEQMDDEELQFCSDNYGDDLDYLITQIQARRWDDAHALRKKSVSDQ